MSETSNLSGFAGPTSSVIWIKSAHRIPRGIDERHSPSQLHHMLMLMMLRWGRHLKISGQSYCPLKFILPGIIRSELQSFIKIVYIFIRGLGTESSREIYGCSQQKSVFRQRAD